MTIIGNKEEKAKNVFIDFVFNYCNHFFTPVLLALSTVTLYFGKLISLKIYLFSKPIIRNIQEEKYKKFIQYFCNKTRFHGSNIINLLIEYLSSSI